MKIAVSATGNDWDAQIDPRFGRCAWFVIVDTDEMRFVAHANEDNQLSGGAGISAASFVVSQGVGAVLTGNCGPKAMDVFSTAGVDVFTGQTGTVREAVERFKSAALTPTTQPTAPEKSGMPAAAAPGAGSGRGMGRCRGGSGRGMGMGGGMGMGRRMATGVTMPAGTPASYSPANPPPSSEPKGENLNEKIEELERQMAAIQAKINDLRQE